MFSRQEALLAADLDDLTDDALDDPVDDGPETGGGGGVGLIASIFSSASTDGVDMADAWSTYLAHASSNVERLHESTSVVQQLSRDVDAQTRQAVRADVVLPAVIAPIAVVLHESEGGEGGARRGDDATAWQGKRAGDGVVEDGGGPAHALSPARGRAVDGAVVTTLSPDGSDRNGVNSVGSAGAAAAAAAAGGGAGTSVSSDASASADASAAAVAAAQAALAAQQAEAEAKLQRDREREERDAIMKLREQRQQAEVGVRTRAYLHPCPCPPALTASCCAGMFALSWSY